jgi:hypothetical protein
MGEINPKAAPDTVAPVMAPKFPGEVTAALAPALKPPIAAPAFQQHKSFRRE